MGQQGPKAFQWKIWQPEKKKAQVTVFDILGFLASSFGAAFCITCLYLAIRGLMGLGGRVSSGAGPGGAPDWIWVVPVSIILGLIFIFISAAFSHRVDGPSLFLPAWSGIFLSLGYNFLDFGFNPQGLADKPGPIGALVACGIVFVIMGAVPVAISIKAGWISLKGKSVRLLILQVASIGLGILAAMKSLKMIQG